jgi:hypothetical protein
VFNSFCKSFGLEKPETYVSLLFSVHISLSYPKEAPLSIPTGG